MDSQQLARRNTTTSATIRRSPKASSSLPMPIPARRRLATENPPTSYPPHVVTLPLSSPASSNPSSTETSPAGSPADPLTRSNTFNARLAAEACKRMQGYVSFKDVEGLGVPPEEDEEDAGQRSESAGRRWSFTRWFGFVADAGAGGAQEPLERAKSCGPGDRTSRL